VIEITDDWKWVDFGSLAGCNLACWMNGDASIGGKLKKRKSGAGVAHTVKQGQ